MSRWRRQQRKRARGARGRVSDEKLSLGLDQIRDRIRDIVKEAYGAIDRGELPARLLPPRDRTPMLHKTGPCTYEVLFTDGVQN